MGGFIPVRRVLLAQQVASRTRGGPLEKKCLIPELSPPMAAALASRAILLLALACSPTARSVALRLDRVDNIAATFGGNTAVWVHAFARSGSSTVLSMVTEAGMEAGAHGRSARRTAGLVNVTGGIANSAEVDNVFAVFEPCDRRDQVSPEIEQLPFEDRCVKLMPGLSQCDFDKVYSFYNWENEHNKLRGADFVFDREQATRACKSADLIAYKTVTRAYEDFRLMSHALPALDADPKLRIIDVMRDPRSIFASWMTTWPFNDTTQSSGVWRNVSALTGICDTLAAGMDVEHPRLSRVVFEEMVKTPYKVHQQVSSFLGAPFGDAARAWVARTFNARDCPGVDMYIAAYSDCHTNSNESVAKWRGVLTTEEEEAFLNHSACLAVAQKFNYTLD